MQKRTRIDLHMHSSASDGKLSPKALAEECFSLELTHAALTDHDTILGQREFLAAAKELGFCAVSGVEMSCEHSQDLHILGYGFDPEHEGFRQMLSAREEYRRTRAARIVEALEQHGYPVSLERVHELAGDGVVGRPHIAMALVEKGYVKNVPQAFRELIGDGCPGDVAKEKIPPEEAIAMIRKAGGKAVLAHPGCMQGEDHEALVKRLSSVGLEGIEAFYPEHTDDDCAYFCALAEKYGLFVTQGSDFHGGVGRSLIPGIEQRGTDKLAKTLKILF